MHRNRFRPGLDVESLRLFPQSAAEGIPLGITLRDPHWGPFPSPWRFWLLRPLPNTNSMLRPPIGVASYGALGTCHLDFQLFNFSGHFRAAQTPTFDCIWLPMPERILVYSYSVSLFIAWISYFSMSPLNYFLLGVSTVLCPSSH